MPGVPQVVTDRNFMLIEEEAGKVSPASIMS
jgi:hypothetical protein